MPPGLIGRGAGGQVFNTVTPATTTWWSGTSNTTLPGQAWGYVSAAFNAGPVFGAIAPNPAETGHVIHAARYSADSYFGTTEFLFVLAGNVPSGTLRLNLGANSVLLSTFTRTVAGSYTQWIKNTPVPAWLQWTNTTAKVIRLSAT